MHLQTYSKHLDITRPVYVTVFTISKENWHSNDPGEDKDLNSQPAAVWKVKPRAKAETKEKDPFGYDFNPYQHKK